MDGRRGESCGQARIRRPQGLRWGSGLGDEMGVEFVAFFAAEEGSFGFVVADFMRME